MNIFFMTTMSRNLKKKKYSKGKSCHRHVFVMKVQKTPSMKYVARFVLFGEMRLLNTIFLLISKRINVYNDLLYGRMRGKNSHSFDLPPTTLLLLAFASSFALTKTSVPLWYLLFFIIIIITSIHSSYLSVFFLCVLF